MQLRWSYPPLKAQTNPIQTPSPVSTVRVVAAGALLNTVQWDDVYAGGSIHGISAYQVRAHALNRNGEWEEQFLDSQNDLNTNKPCGINLLKRQAVVRSVQGRSAFRVSIRAENEIGWGEWGPEFEFMSGPKATLPGAVDWTHMSCVDVTPCSFKVWKPVTREFVVFHLFFFVFSIILLQIKFLFHTRLTETSCHDFVIDMISVLRSYAGKRQPHKVLG